MQVNSNIIAIVQKFAFMVYELQVIRSTEIFKSFFALALLAHVRLQIHKQDLAWQFYLVMQKLGAECAAFRLKCRIKC